MRRPSGLPESPQEKVAQLLQLFQGDEKSQENGLRALSDEFHNTTNFFHDKVPFKHLEERGNEIKTLYETLLNQAPETIKEKIQAHFEEQRAILLQWIQQSLTQQKNETTTPAISLVPMSLFHIRIGKIIFPHSQEFSDIESEYGKTLMQKCITTIKQNYEEVKNQIKESDEFDKKQRETRQKILHRVTNFIGLSSTKFEYVILSTKYLQFIGDSAFILTQYLGASLEDIYKILPPDTEQVLQSFSNKFPHPEQWNHLFRKPESERTKQIPQY